MSRLLSSTITIRLTKQIYIADQHLRCVLHFILQLLCPHIVQSFGEPTPYRLKVDGRVMGLNNREDMGSDGRNGIAVEGLEVLPCCLAPLDYGVGTLTPDVMLSGRF